MTPRPSNKLKVTLGIAIILTLALLSWAWADYRCYEGYRRIAPGYSEKQVVALLGRPPMDYPSHESVRDAWQSDGQFAIAGDVVREYHYPIPLQPLREWVIGFDANGHVILKSEIISP